MAGFYLCCLLARKQAGGDGIGRRAALLQIFEKEWSNWPA
jgi:hypothetical protein